MALRDVASTEMCLEDVERCRTGNGGDVMRTTVTVGVDGSDESLVAARHGAAMALRRGDSLTLVYRPGGTNGADALIVVDGTVTPS